MKKIVTLFLISGLLVQTSCKKEEDEKEIIPSVPTITVNLSHNVSGVDLQYNQRIYKTPADIPMEVRHLEYYISDFKLQSSSGNWVSVTSQAYLINPETGRTATLIANVPIGTYKAISCMIGIPEKDNYTGALPNTIENVNMAWPDPIGGGYHFMKFEGNYLDEVGDWRGYTVHLGKNGYQSANVMDNIQLNVTNSTTEINLSMDLNEWFQTPYLFDFYEDGNYTMAIDSLMELVSINGQDCLTYEN